MNIQPDIHELAHYLLGACLKTDEVTYQQSIEIAERINKYGVGMYSDLVELIDEELKRIRNTLLIKPFEENIEEFYYKGQVDCEITSISMKIAQFLSDRKNYFISLWAKEKYKDNEEDVRLCEYEIKEYIKKHGKPYESNKDGK
jgi:hypothetical protein